MFFKLGYAHGKDCEGCFALSGQAVRRSHEVGGTRAYVTPVPGGHEAWAEIRASAPLSGVTA